MVRLWRVMRREHKGICGYYEEPGTEVTLRQVKTLPGPYPLLCFYSPFNWVGIQPHMQGTQKQFATLCPFSFRHVGLLLPWMTLAHTGNSGCATWSHEEFKASSPSALAFPSFPFPFPQWIKQAKQLLHINKQMEKKDPLSSNTKSTPTWFWNYRSFHSQGSEYPLHPEWLYHTHRL